MLEESQDVMPEPLSAADPYGDVALGVECAWPAFIPADKALEAVGDASISIH
jgi:hypothetical protein